MKRRIVITVAALASALAVYGVWVRRGKVAAPVSSQAINSVKVATQTKYPEPAFRPNLTIPAPRTHEEPSTPPNDEIFSEEYRLKELEREIAELETNLRDKRDGSSEEGEARELLNDILSQLDESRRTEVSVARFECYSNGCVVGLRYSDEEAFMGTSGQFMTGSLAMTWQGPRAQTGPKPSEGGGVESNWYLYFSPSEAGEGHL